MTLTDLDAIRAACDASPYDRTPASILADALDDAGRPEEAHEQRLRVTMMKILEDVDDDRPRLEYAEMVGGGRGEFIRVQCELAIRNGYAGTNESSWILELQFRMFKLRCRERDLWYRSPTAKLFVPKGFDLVTVDPQTTSFGFSLTGSPDNPVIWANVSRGFPTALTCSWADFQHYAPKMIWWAPQTCWKCDGGKSHKVTDGTYHCLQCRGTGEIPGATMACPFTADRCEEGCKRCSGSGRVPAPMPRDALPITKANVVIFPHGGIEEAHLKWLRERWPTIRKWTLPA